MLSIIPLTVQSPDVKRERGRGELQSNISYRFKWIMKSNVCIAPKFPQVRCNLQAGHLEQPFRQIKSSHRYWCGNYAPEKSDAVALRGEGDSELSPSGCRRVAGGRSGQSASVCPLSRQKSSQSLNLFQRHIRKHSYMWVINISLWNFKRLWYCYAEYGTLLCCQFSPASRTRAGTKKLEKRLVVSVFLCIFMPLGM